MKVKELMEVLSGLDPELEIIVSKDPEGNGYDTLYSHWVATVVNDDGEYTPFDLNDKEELDYFNEYEYNELPNFKALVLSP